MSTGTSIPLYHLPPVVRLDLVLPTRYAVLHLVNDDTYRLITDLQARFEDEQSSLTDDFTLTHVFIGANPVTVSQWLQSEKSTAKVYWYGPEDSDCPVISNKSVSDYPYYLVYEKESLIQARTTFPPTFESLITELEERKLRGLAEAATSLRPSDISSPVIVSLLLHDFLSHLPLPDSSPPIPPPPPILSETEQLLSAQKAEIEALKLQVAMREKEVEDLRTLTHSNPVFLSEQTKQKQEIAQAKVIVPLIPPPEVGDFWNEEPDEELAAYPNSQLQDISAVKGLWILSAENEMKQPPVQQFRSSNAFSMASSMQSLVQDSFPSARSPKIPLANMQTPKHTSKASSFLEQRQRHLEKMMEKQPLGRDGKRLPLPRVSNGSHKSTPSLKKTPSYRKNALVASEFQTPLGSRSRFA